MVMRRRAVAAARPARQWTEVSTNFALSLTATGSAVVWGLQAPAAAANLTALPPEDVVLMRIRGSFQVTLSAGSASWSLALTVQDQAWTPAATFNLDADKRLLWTRTFNSTGLTGPVSWCPPGYMTDASDPILVAADAAWTELDISPTVKLEAGQGLYLVAYESGGTATLTVSSTEMRMLWQVKKRR